MSTIKFSAGSPIPKIQLPTVSSGNITFGEPQGTNDWQLIIVYRGLFCPLCKKYLKELEDLKDQFLSLKVDIVAISADSFEDAKKIKEEINLNFPIGYGLSVSQMQELGLYISNPRSPAESDHAFSEPGLFVINADGNVQIIDISNIPFARPNFESLVSGINFIRSPENNYPIRGTFK